MLRSFLNFENHCFKKITVTEKISGCTSWDKICAKLHSDSIVHDYSVLLSNFIWFI